MEYFFTADEHYGHANIIRFCGRPYSSVEEMDEDLIRRHNDLVVPSDTVVHVGDFTLKGKEPAGDYVRRLNGSHVFVEGSHDYWLKKGARQIWEKRIDGVYVVACHYPMRSWPRSFHGSVLAFGHEHGRMKPVGRSWDVGVDNNGFYPVPLEELVRRADAALKGSKRNEEGR